MTPVYPIPIRTARHAYQLFRKGNEAFKDYEKACPRFFRELDSYALQVRTLLTENLEIIGK